MIIRKAKLNIFLETIRLKGGHTITGNSLKKIKIQRTKCGSKEFETRGVIKMITMVTAELFFNISPLCGKLIPK